MRRRSAATCRACSFIASSSQVRDSSSRRSQQIRQFSFSLKVLGRRGGGVDRGPAGTARPAGRDSAAFRTATTPKATGSAHRHHIQALTEGVLQATEAIEVGLVAFARAVESVGYSSCRTALTQTPLDRLACCPPVRMRRGKVPQRHFPTRHPGTRMSGMTGPDDAFLAPDDALRDFDEDAVDLMPDEDEGPTEFSADDEADPPGAVGTEAAPG
jgi:hypothetical protein